MNKSHWMLLALLISSPVFAQDDTQSTVGFSTQSGATHLVFDMAGEKDQSTIGIRGSVPLDNTARAVEAMNERWHKKSTPSIELYGTIDIGYQHKSN